MTWLAETLSVAVLVIVMVLALLRPRGLPEATAAVPGTLLLCLVGAISWSNAGEQIVTMGPTVIFLAAVLALSELARAEGVFRYSGQLMATRAKSSSRRLLWWVFIIASVTTAVLSLDATIVLLTPIILTTTRRLNARPEPHLYATAHLANTASLLLPVSNLTNLLAVAAVPELTFARFTTVMALPWLLTIGIEWLAMRIEFRDELSRATTANTDRRQQAPIAALIILGLTLAGFAVCSLLGAEPFWAALAGVVAFAVLRFIHHNESFGIEAGRALRATKPLFLAFVLCLGIIVEAVVKNGLGSLIDRLVPSGQTLVSLLAVAVIAALLSNLINNLPAVLVLLPFVAPAGWMAVLTMLVGVNIGPNLSYAGSLATLLWRRIIGEHDLPAHIGRFTRLGLLTVPANILVSVCAIWAMSGLFGMELQLI
ncbi:SLC13 family permease [Cutibacterium sp.]|uniref:SLC13 family permease n=1 Tax=Cutibacterium sp. TaxID=1912221 RepID=UPI0026DA7492|nr:SLC13 family permease [Cutibacterium sp.]MDO4411785.1 ArsB/NhaD family transporter [Cutibacterium sp.]